METFRPRCTHGDVISMKTAQFGRMRVGRCITSDAFQLQQLQPDSLGCSANVLEYFDHICSGKSTCDVSVSNPDLYNYRPCSAQLTVYLEASYTCISGNRLHSFSNLGFTRQTLKNMLYAVAHCDSIVVTRLSSRNYKDSCRYMQLLFGIRQLRNTVKILIRKIGYFIVIELI